MIFAGPHNLKGVFEGSDEVLRQRIGSPRMKFQSYSTQPRASGKSGEISSSMKHFLKLHR